MKITTNQSYLVQFHKNDDENGDDNGLTFANTTNCPTVLFTSAASLPSS